MDVCKSQISPEFMLASLIGFRAFTEMETVRKRSLDLTLEVIAAPCL